MIDQATIDRINDAAQIVDVVSDYVTLRRRGVNMIGLCPFHNEKTPSFTVSPAKGIFKCFGCSEGGNSVHFIMKQEQLSYYEALKFLAKKYHIEVRERELSDEEQAARNDRESMLLVNEFAQKYFTNTLHHHIDGKAIGLGYLRERGFRDDIILKFQLGYCLDERDAFTKSAVNAGYNKDFLVKTGLTIEGENNYVADRFRGRVMFPVHSLSGKVLAFGGRVLKKDEKTAKYVNSPESEIYHKSNELYGIYFAKQSIVKHDRCFLVEGYTDVISMHQSGIENVVASSGTSLTPGQIRLIHRFTENVTVLYDGDPAGIKASIRGIDLLLEEGLNIRVLLLPDGDDPDSFSRKHNASDFIEFVNKHSVDFMQFKTNLLLHDAGNDPIKRASLVQDIVRSIAMIPNQIIRSEYVKECSTLLNVDEKLLYHEINKIKNTELEAKILKKTVDEKRETIPDLSAPANTEPKSENKFNNEERNLVRALIKFGSDVLFVSKPDENSTETPVTVSDYILGELQIDQLTFRNELHEKIRQEYIQHSTRENFNAERFFINHPEVEVSKLAADLISEKYILSKIHSKFHKLETETDRLAQLAPRFVFEYKLAVIMDKRKEKLMEMKTAAETRNEKLMLQLMNEIEAIDNFKNMLSKELDRVLNLI